MALNLQDDWSNYPNLSSIDHDVGFYRDRFETDASRLFARDVDHMISLIGPGPGGSESGEIPNLQPFELHYQNLPLREDSCFALNLIIAEAFISLEFLEHVVTDVDSLQYLLRVSNSTESIFLALLCLRDLSRPPITKSSQLCRDDSTTIVQFVLLSSPSFL